MKPLAKALLIFVFLSLGAANASAAEVLALGSGIGPGDKLTANDGAEGLDISVEVQRSPNQGQVYVVAKFCNRGSVNWVGGIRLSNDRPSKAHTTLRVDANKCRSYGEHLLPTSLFIYVNQEQRK